MLRKILRFTGAVCLAACILGFAAVLGAQSTKHPCSAGSPLTPGAPCTGTDNSWAFNTCFGNQQGSCDSGELCYHCKCNADAQTTVPVTAYGQTCQMWTGSAWNYLSSPYLVYSITESNLKNWINQNVRPAACQNYAIGYISYGLIGIWSPNGAYDYTMCQATPFSCDQNIYGCHSACQDPSK